jgi:ubiquitin C-terminal hydrolase
MDVAALLKERIEFIPPIKRKIQLQEPTPPPSLQPSPSTLPNEIITARGLPNAGQTCYMNSTIQALLFSHTINHHLSATLACFPDYLLLIKWLWRNLKNINSRLSLHKQEDAHEFLTSLLAFLQSDYLKGTPYRLLSIPLKELSKKQKLKREKLDLSFLDTTPVYSNITFRLQSVLECSICHYKSESIVSRIGLELEILNGTNIDSLLRQYAKPDNLTWKCDKCQQTSTCTKYVKMETLPKTLILVLKRFNHFGRKFVKRIGYAPNLSIPSNLCPTENMYTLTSIVSHYGSSTSSGHYIAYVRDGDWKKCNDELVSDSDWRGVVAEGSNVYIMFWNLVPPATVSQVESVEKVVCSMPGFSLGAQVSTRRELPDGWTVSSTSLPSPPKSVPRSSSDSSDSSDPSNSSDPSESSNKVGKSSSESSKSDTEIKKVAEHANTRITWDAKMEQKRTVLETVISLEKPHQHAPDKTFLPWEAESTAFEDRLEKEQKWKVHPSKSDLQYDIGKVKKIKTHVPFEEKMRVGKQFDRIASGAPLMRGKGKRGRTFEDRGHGIKRTKFGDDFREEWGRE